MKDSLILQSLNLIEETSPWPRNGPRSDYRTIPISNLPSSSTKLSSSQARTLLLAPPSIASHEEKLRNVLAPHDRAFTDFQMLDRLAASLVTLPPSTYDLVLILTDADGIRKESTQLLS